MTPDQALSCLKELKALERLHAVIAALPAPSFEWRCALTALDDRLRWVRYCLSQEDPHLVAAVQERYDIERRFELLEQSTAVSHVTGSDASVSDALPTVSRVIH